MLTAINELGREISDAQHQYRSLGEQMHNANGLAEIVAIFDKNANDFEILAERTKRRLYERDYKYVINQIDQIGVAISALSSVSASTKSDLNSYAQNIKKNAQSGKKKATDSNN